MISIPKDGKIFDKNYNNLFNCFLEEQKSEFYHTSHFFLHPGVINNFDVWNNKNNYNWLLTSSNNNLFIWNWERELNSYYKLFAEKKNPAEIPNFYFKNENKIIFCSWITINNNSNYVILQDIKSNLILFDLNDFINYTMVFNGDKVSNVKESLKQELYYKWSIALGELYGCCKLDSKYYPNVLFLVNNKVTILNLNNEDFQKNPGYLTNSDYDENYKFDPYIDNSNIELDSKGIIIHSFNNKLYFYDIKLIKDKEIFKLDFQNEIINIKLLDPESNIIFVMLPDLTITLDYSNFNIKEEDMIITIDKFTKIRNFDLDVNPFQKGSFMISGEDSKEVFHGGIIKISRDNKLNN